MYVRPRPTLGDNTTLYTASAELPAVGTIFGGPVGGAIGSTLNALTSIFGGKTHVTAGGRTYHQATSTFKNNQLAIQSLVNSYNKKNGLPNIPFTSPPANGDSSPYYIWMSGWLAYYLQNPALITGNAKQYDTLKANGSFDQAINIQNEIIASLGSGVLSPSAPEGTIDASGQFTAASLPATETAATATGSLDLSSGNWLVWGGIALAAYLLLRE